MAKATLFLDLGVFIGPLTRWFHCTTITLVACLLYFVFLSSWIRRSVLLYFPNPPRSTEPHSTSFLYSLLFLSRHMTYLSMLMMRGVLLTIVLAWIQILPFAAHAILHLSSTETGLLLSMLAAGVAVGGLLCSLLLTILSTVSLFRSSLIVLLLICIGLILMPGTNTYILFYVFLLCLLSGIALGCMEPLVLSQALQSIPAYYQAQASAYLLAIPWEISACSALFLSQFAFQSMLAIGIICVISTII